MTISLLQQALPVTHGLNLVITNITATLYYTSVMTGRHLGLSACVNWEHISAHCGLPLAHKWRTRASLQTCIKRINPGQLTAGGRVAPRKI